MYKLVAMDIDGTLLDSYGNISKENIEAIKKAKEQNIEVVLTSGRMPKAMLAIASEANANNYLICGNGAMIYDVNKEEIIYNNYLSKKKLLEIIKICEENSIYYNVYTENGIIAKSLNYNTLYYYKDNLTKPDENRTHINIVENVYDYIESKNEKILKIMICDEHKSVFNSIVRRLKDVDEVEVLEVSHMSRKIIKQGTEEKALEYFYTEVSAKDVDKWSALEELMKIVDISKEELVTIGDNANDVKMIKNAGLGIAMGESAPYVKSVADEITLSNDEDGVAIILRKIFEIN